MIFAPSLFLKQKRPPPPPKKKRERKKRKRKKLENWVYQLGFKYQPCFCPTKALSSFCGVSDSTTRVDKTFTQSKTYKLLLHRFALTYETWVRFLRTSTNRRISGCMVCRCCRSVYGFLTIVNHLIKSQHVGVRRTTRIDASSRKDASEISLFNTHAHNR